MATPGRGVLGTLGSLRDLYGAAPRSYLSEYTQTREREDQAHRDTLGRTMAFTADFTARWSRAFRQMFESATDLPALTAVRVEHDIARDELRITVQCSGQEQLAEIIRCDQLRDLYRVDARQLESTIRSAYSDQYEDAYVAQGVRRYRQNLEHLIRTSTDQEAINQAYEDLYRAERHVREYHQRGPRTGQYNALANAAPSMTATEVRLRQMQATQSLDQQARYFEEYNRAVYQSMIYGTGVVTIDRFGEIGTPEAQQRGIQLLKENLTPKQREQYEANKYFDVKGGSSGKTYRIKHGRQMNIEELDKTGKRVRGLCFLPSSGIAGPLVAGDCMLTQKIALETDEVETLKVANKF